MSPLSAQLDLAMLYFGARGQTVQSLQCALGLPNEPVGKVQAFFSQLVQNLTNESTLEVADAIYISDQYQTRDSFSAIGSTVFDAKIDAINFNNPQQAANTMNSWVASKTNNEIQDLINPNDISPSTEIILLNTIYFADQWMSQFQVDLTKKATFFPNGGCSKLAIEVDMMQNEVSPTGGLRCKELLFKKKSLLQQFYGYGNITSLNAGVVPLGFSNSDIQMYIILPNEPCGGLAKTEAALTNLNLAELNAQIQFSKVDISLPRFTIKSNLVLNTALEQVF